MKNSKIEWTDHTLNFWHGCFKVSSGCANCYAEALVKRWHKDANIWGPPILTRRQRTKGPWRDVLKWDRDAGERGVRERVFCMSMGDFFEAHPELDDVRDEAFDILEALQNLDVQLLTKRPELVYESVPVAWRRSWPAHIWIGTSVENQETADLRIPELLRIPARVRFLSVEPLLGPIDNLWKYLATNSLFKAKAWGSGVLGGQQYIGDDGSLSMATQDLSGRYFYDGLDLHWIIVGGESGPRARPMNPTWLRDIRDQVKCAGASFFFKQWGEWAPADHAPAEVGDGKWGSWLNGKFVEYYVSTSEPLMYRISKKRNGRTLDGETWSEFPRTEEREVIYA